MSPWYFVFLGVCVIVVVGQLWWTRQHARNLDEHKKRMEEIYRRHG